ncbi:unnamed protein product [Rhizophagus irregularis]|uniref:Kelch-like protein 17 n=1 Tax=Rhizophagus irregularis TaxID=588596 RepID=A0A2N1NDE9_9GLOM|nr:hypothetical protein RhiirC2_777899 [Rhizophagus irregularis]CAB4384784.1 unnamed protein product [Rhizophagus irregularis]
MSPSYIKLESEISESFGNLLENKTESNVIIHVGEGHDFKEFHAHSIILRCRSEYFEYKFSNKFIDIKENGKYIIKEPKILPQAFEVILKYLYTGHINFDKNSGPVLLNIISASNKFMLKRLVIITEDFIIKNHQRFIQSDPVGILQVIHYSEFIVNLQKICVKIICSNPEFLFESDKFINLPDYLLETILERDDLNLKESEIWDILINWVLAQNMRQQAFNLNQIIPVGTILRRFIHLIDFFEISSNDYFHKLSRYEDILPHKLREDILNFYLNTRYEPTPTMYMPRCLKPRPDSTIINRRHVTLFSNWIDRCSGNITHKFDLIYKASRDGSTPKDFHAKCDNKGAALIVIKISDSEKIVGGYNPLGWDSSGITKPAMNSYIFKFSERRKLQTANISYSNGNPQSIICNSDIFGFNDLYNYNCTWIGSNPSSYPKLDGLPKGVFYVDDYEVFQVKRETTIDNSRRVSRSSRTSQSLKINGSTRTSQIETGLLNRFSQVEKENLGNEVVDEKRLSRVSTFVKTLFGKDK